MNLVDVEIMYAPLNQKPGEVKQAVAAEIDVVCIDIQHVVRIHLLFDMLQHQRGFPYASRPFDAYYAVAPVDIGVEVPVKACVGFAQQFLEVGC